MRSGRTQPLDLPRPLGMCKRPCAASRRRGLAVGQVVGMPLFPLSLTQDLGIGGVSATVASDAQGDQIEVVVGMTTSPTPVGPRHQMVDVELHVGSALAAIHASPAIALSDSIPDDEPLVGGIGACHSAPVRMFRPVRNIAVDPARGTRSRTKPDRRSRGGELLAALFACPLAARIADGRGVAPRDHHNAASPARRLSLRPRALQRVEVETSARRAAQLPGRLPRLELLLANEAGLHV